MLNLLHCSLTCLLKCKMGFFTKWKCSHSNKFCKPNKYRNIFLLIFNSTWLKVYLPGILSTSILFPHVCFWLFFAFPFCPWAYLSRNFYNASTKTGSQWAHVFTWRCCWSGICCATVFLFVWYWNSYSSQNPWPQCSSKGCLPNPNSVERNYNTFSISELYQSEIRKWN